MNKNILLFGLVFLVMLSSSFAVLDDADIYYSFDDDNLSGVNPLDLSGNGNDGTNSPAMTTGVTGLLQQAFSSTVTSAVDTGVLDTSTFSVSFWYKGDDLSTYGAIAGAFTSSGSRWVFDKGRTTGELVFYIRGTSDKVLSDTGYSDNTWYHLVGTSDGTNIKFYINGVLVASDTIIGTYTGGTKNIVIGRYTAGTAPAYGDYDEFWYSNSRVLTDGSCSVGATCGGEIAELYNAGAGYNPYEPLPPSAPDTLTVQVKDADNLSNINGVTLNWEGTNYTNATGNIVSINITAEGGNASLLQNFSVYSDNYFDLDVTNWNLTNTYLANLTQYPFISAYDSFSGDVIQNFTIRTCSFSYSDNYFNGTFKECLSQSTYPTEVVNYTTTNGFLYLPFNETLQRGVEFYADNYVQRNVGHVFLGATDLNQSLAPLPLEDFSILTPTNNTETNGTSINITWTQAVSPTGRTVNYTIESIYLSNSSVYETFYTTNLYYDLDISTYDSDDYIITITAVEDETSSEVSQSVNVFVNRPNFLYFYNQQTGNPIEGANITITLPNYATPLETVSDEDGKVFFLSFYNDTLQTGDFEILFEDFIGYVTPITFYRTYNSLPVNESFDITVTNINISIFYRSNFSTFTQNATVIIEGLSSQVVNNGSVFIQNASIVNGEYRITVSADGFFNEEKTFTFTGQDDLDLNIYMLELNSSNSGTVTIRTVDEFSRLLAGSQVNLLGYDSNTLSYLEVSECFTDSNGECKFLVETNTKSYKFTATKRINGLTVSAVTNAQIFEDDISGGQVVLFSEETITLTLSATDQFQLSPLQNIEFSITPYDQSFNNVTNQSNIAVSFNSIDGQTITVCVEYFSLVGGVKTSLTGNTFCLSGSSGQVTESAYFTLNRSKDYVADIYIKTSSGNFNLESYRYYSDASFLEKLENNAMLPYFVIFIWIFLIGGSMMLKNISLSGIAIIIGAWGLWVFFPSGIMVSVAVLQTVLGANLVYLGRKKEDFG